MQRIGREIGNEYFKQRQMGWVKEKGTMGNGESERTGRDCGKT